MTTKQQIDLECDCLILGGGAGGLTVASGLSQLGLRVILVEKTRALGGDCLHYGCVPSKSLLACAKVCNTVEHAAKYGVTTTKSDVNWQQVKDYVQHAIDTIAVHDDPRRFEGYGCQVIFAQPEFCGTQLVKCDGKYIKAKKIVLATGSSTFIPPIPGLADVNYDTNETIFTRKSFPQKLVILGAGPIGLELGQAFARLGAQVSIIDQVPRLLPILATEQSDELRMNLEKEGINFIFGAKVTAVEQQQAEFLLTYQDDKSSTHTLHGDGILVATGRKPNIADLALEKTGVSYNKSGVIVNKRLQTSNKHIFAVGDVIASPMRFTHMAEHHGGVVIANIAFKIPKKVATSVFPAVIYTAPEVATVGLSEQQALQLPGSELLLLPYKDLDRAVTAQQTAGQIRLVVQKKRIIAVTISGENAGELIASFALAMKNNLKLSAISATIVAYPTWSQGVRRAVNSYYGPRLFNQRVRGIVRLLQRFLP